MRNGGVLLRARRELSAKASSFGMAGSVAFNELAGNALQREDLQCVAFAAYPVPRRQGEVIIKWQLEAWQRTT
jgi:hypothetical protein